MKTSSSIIVQAEEGRFQGVAVAHVTPGFSGAGYVNGTENEGDWLEVDVQIQEDSFYELSVRYAVPDGYRSNALLVDGNCYGYVRSRPTDGFVTERQCSVYLKTGTHTLALLKAWDSGVEVDCFLLSAVDSPELSRTPRQLINPKATAETVSLWNYLNSQFGKGLLTGQHTASGFTPAKEFAYIESLTGKQPAIRGFDLLSYTHATETADPTPHKLQEIAENKGSIESAIEWTTVHNGIVTLTWHWFAPTGGTDKTFYTKNTDFNLPLALKPDSNEHQLLLADIDAIAEQLKKLQDANVPVLWRPLHEADGAWFWWGAFGAEPCKQLWRLLYDRLTNLHELHNLIWVWNSHVQEWYPGDDETDIDSCDIYAPSANYGPLRKPFEQVDALAGGRKLIALGENGSIPDPDQLIASRTPWLWYMTWGEGFVIDGKSTSDEQLKKVYHHPSCITLDRLPNWRHVGHA
ncbi:glycosyl hydrolase [Paenibacillus sp. BC26]|uniref:glycosyl hydrolase n=1 Tax=Paenibacillus sp. BC26 TaxID=1881032 RepID=UPI0008EFF39E|nr:glycosyl hydrolase [Paenibacillus sp. BC26]SFT26902.1 mannan endo-1,4-beta-mannosidase [Paenibacillus sp. BC26]